MKSLFSFTPASITVNGRTFSAEYKERETHVCIIAHVEGLEHDVTVKVCQDDPRYPDIMQALHPDAAETISAEPAAPAQAQDAAETIPAEPAAPAEAQDAARRIPEKTFIGQSIVGKGWKILFDGNAERTRIIFDTEPVKAAVAALADAKFYYSPTMGSYNKKLTFKAYRAAVKVSETLSAIYA